CALPIFRSMRGAPFRKEQKPSPFDLLRENMSAPVSWGASRIPRSDNVLSRSEQKRLRSLKRRKYREGEGLFLAEGVRLVEAMLDAGVAPRLVVASPTLEDTERGRRLAERLAGLDVLRRVEDRVLAEFAATASPLGVLAVAEIPRHDLGAIRVEGPATVLVLDGVQDPGNFGTLVRTADAFGAAFVAVLPGTVDPWNPKSVRAAA